MMNDEYFVSNGIKISRLKLSRMKKSAYSLEYENHRTNAMNDKKMVEEHIKIIMEVANASQED